MKLSPAHVKGARGLLGLSQQELADAAGVTLQTVSNFEAERHTPKEDTLFRIQAALEDRGIVFFNDDDPGVRLIRARIKPHLRPS